MFHRDERINDAIIKLSDALCEYERSTGIESILIIREHNFVYRATSGKLVNDAIISDKMLIDMITEK